MCVLIRTLFAGRSCLLLFRSSQISFFVYGHLWRQSCENTKIVRNLCLHFARQDGQVGKTGGKNHATKMTKIQKNKRQK